MVDEVKHLATYNLQLWPQFVVQISFVDQQSLTLDMRSLRSIEELSMKARARQFLTGCLAISVFLSAGLPAAVAQESQPIQQVQNAPEFTQQELDQMLAPIALYPDSLLTQILMASTYPLEVVQAARWSHANPGFQGDQAVRVIEQQNWDPSVKSLVAFPQLLERMDRSLDWTERLGNAFLSQESRVWDTVQNLRQRANAAGNLQSNDQVRVEQDGPTYVIESSRPDVIYVPYYNPLVVYGDWWWPGYAPMYWSAWPGYYARPGYGRGYYWGNGITVGFGFFFGGVDWRQRHVNVFNRNSFYYRNVNRWPNQGNGWQHDPDHRRGVPYRNPLLREQFNRPAGVPRTADAGRDFRGRFPHAANSPDPVPRVQPGGRAQQRPTLQDPAAVQGAATSGGPRPAVVSVPRSVPTYPAQRGVVPERRPQALEGVGNGQDARNASARGQASFQSRPPLQPPRSIAAPTQQPLRSTPGAPQQQPSAPAPQRNAPGPVQRESPPQQQQPASGPNNVPRQRGER